MCKHKLKKRIKVLEAEIAELKSKVDGHVGHYIYSYPNLTAYPYTYSPLGTAVTTSWTGGITYTNDSGNGGASSEG